MQCFIVGQLCWDTKARIAFRFRNLVVCWVLAGTVSPAMGESWPTFMHDIDRSGLTSEPLALPLHLHWSRRWKHAPAPAWPPPAKQDFWHHKTKLKTRITFDHAFPIVGKGSRIYVPSSADDQLRCLDASTGNINWTFFAEAPIRLAPSLVGDRVVFGADDGNVYALDAETGELIWKSRAPEIGRRFIPGNGRIIHSRPIRTGILAVGETGYFTAGIFPNQGVFYYSIDLRNGKILDTQRLSISPQGYLQAKGGKIFTPTGRDPAGKFIGELKRRGKPVGQLEALPREFPFAFVGTRKLRIAGGDGKVAAFSAMSGEKLWSDAVTGKARSMAIVHGRLFVSTDAGILYCFGSQTKTPVEHYDWRKTVRVASRSASRIFDQLDSKSGFGLFVEPDDVKTAVAIAQQTKLRIVIATASHQKLIEFRNKLTDRNLYGRVVVHTVEKTLPYADRIFDLVVGGEANQIRPLLGGSRSIGIPQHGEFITGVQGSKGEWTHLYANSGNTACSQSKITNENLKLQWFGEPGPRNMVDRHLRSMSPLACNGRLFALGLDHITAIHAHNGAILWQKTVPELTRIGILKDSGSAVATDDSLYVATRSQCKRLDAETGENLMTIPVPAQNRDWSYLANVGALIIGGTTMPNASRRTLHRDSILEGAYTDNRPIVVSDSLFVTNRVTGKKRWHYHSETAIPNPTIAINADRVFFMESSVRWSEESGRIPYSKLLGARPNFICLDLTSGQLLWKQPLELQDHSQSVYVCCTDRFLAVVNSFNLKTVHYGVQVFDIQTGRRVWDAVQDNGLKLGGDHGEQDKHPVIVGDRIVVEPNIYALNTGRMIPEVHLRKRGYGCGTISASANTLFFRSRNPTGFDLLTGDMKSVCAVSRPGCWINMIPAGDFLLIPEGSSGCTCNFPVQTSMGFIQAE